MVIIAWDVLDAFPGLPDSLSSNGFVKWAEFGEFLSPLSFFEDGAISSLLLEPEATENNDWKDHYLKLLVYL